MKNALKSTVIPTILFRDPDRQDQNGKFKKIEFENETQVTTSFDHYAVDEDLPKKVKKNSYLINTYNILEIKLILKIMTYNHTTIRDLMLHSRTSV